MVPPAGAGGLPEDYTPLIIGVLGNVGSWYCADLQRALESRGHQFRRLEFPALTALVQTGCEGFTAGDNLHELDGLIVRTMPPGSLEQVVFRMDLLARLEANGVPVLNPPKSLECAVDKYLTTSRLSAAGLPVPRTVICENADTALAAMEQLGGDVVVKPLFGSEGRGILRVSDPDLALRTFRTLERISAVLYLQEFIHHPGHDLRVLILNGKPLGAIRRTATQGFRTNVSQHGKAEPCRPTDTEVEWALRATAVTGAVFAGVDILYGPDGQGYVIEVNAVPGWRAFSRATGIDVAERVVELLEQRSRAGVE